MAQPDPSFSLRPARPDDGARVADIWWRGWRDGHVGHVSDEVEALRTEASFQSRAPGRVDDTTVAEIDGEVAGFVMVVADEVEQVYVDANHRGTPVATVLLAEAERQVAAGGHDTAWLAVVAGNARARRFYQRQGWRDAGAVDYGAADGDGGTVTITSHRYEKPVG